MKRIILLALLVYSFGLYAQTDYYWYKGQKIFLERLATKKFIVFDTINDITSLKEALDRSNMKIKKFEKSNISLNLKEYKTKKIKEINWAVIESKDFTSLNAKKGIIYDAPYFLTSNKVEAGLSNLFYVKLNYQADTILLEKLAKENKVEILGNNKFMPLWYTLMCTNNSKGNALAMANLFYETQLFSASEPDLMTDDFPFCTNDTHFNNQWGLNNTGQNGGTNGLDINFCQVRPITLGNQNIIVAVIDQGVELNHPDLTNMHPTSFDTESGTSPSQVRGNHGTACAGIIGANSNNSLGVSGVAPNSRIMSISNSLAGTPNSRQRRADGINFAVKNGASVISNSWGSAVQFQIIDDAITNAITNGRNGLGCVMVFSAGNNNGAVSYPANSNTNIIVVGAMSPCGQRKSPTSCDGETWWGSNFGAQLDISAPGVLIPTTDRQGANGYNTAAGVAGDYIQNFNGTSAACPQVAAVAALILSQNPYLTQLQVANIIESTAQKVGGYNFQTTEGRPNGTWHNEVGYGLLDAFAAVQEAINCSPIIEENSNETWNNEKLIFCGLTIKQNATLEIKSIVKLSKNAKIVIEKGGKLIVNGGKLTNLDNHPWQGIYVEGNRTLPQTFAHQGALILQNGAVIENARTAVHMRRVADNWWGNGGIIQATNATFRNNWRNVAFGSYDHPSISWFTSCTFETNSQTIHSEHNVNVSIWNVQGVTFTNCIFTDTRPNIDYHTPGKSRNGIFTIDASFLVENCLFEGMKYGIYATSSVANRTLKVYNSVFSSYNGIYFNNMNNAHVVGNNFYVKPGYMYSGPTQDTYGLYIENSRNFEVTGNNFTSTGISAPCPCNSFGVIARNTGTITHEIYRNDFSGFHVAVMAIGQNRDHSDFAGLEIRCNRFNNTHHSDITIEMDRSLNPNIRQGIKHQQGAIYTSYSNTSLGGNIFSTNKWYQNFAMPIVYYHHLTQSHPNLIPANITSNSITLRQRNHNYQYATSCPARQITRSTQMLLAEMDEGLTGQRDAEAQLTKMTDGGNTQLMLQQVEMAGKTDAYDTYRHLMKTSPWLSEEVLVAVAGKQEGLNHAMVRDILVANPQSAKSEQVTKVLNNRKDKLPAVMMARIEAGKRKWGEMEILQQRLAGYKTRYELALNAMIRHHMHEGDKKGREAITNLLLGTNDIRYRYLLAELYYSWGDDGRGAELLKSIGKKISRGEDWQFDNHRQYLDYYTLLGQ